jgi:serine protease Do
MFNLTKSQIKTIILSIIFGGLSAAIVSIIIWVGLIEFKNGILAQYLQKMPFQVSLPHTTSTPANQATSTPTAPPEPQIIEKKIYIEKPDRETMIVKAVEATSPAVVSIVVKKNVPTYEICYINPFEGDPFFKDFDIKIPQPCQKGTEKQKIGAGSGFIVKTDGLIVTNKHVVADKDAEYSVILSDGSQFTAQVLARDPALDFAVLKINKSGLPIVKLGDSSKIKPGQTVIAIGNALGEFQNTVSIGIISGLGRTVTATGGGVTEVLENVIQTDAAINPGNSGGPLLNLNGEVIGINVAMSSGSENIAFALPINTIKPSLEQVEQYGEIRRPAIGVRYIPVTPELKEKLHLSVDYGAYITKGPAGEPAVTPGSPAETAGLREGDIILEVDGVKLTPEYNLNKIVPKYKIDDEVKLKVLKKSGEIVDIKVTLIKMSS